MFRPNMAEFIEKSMESLILNRDYIDNLIISKNDSIFEVDFSKLEAAFDGAATITYVEDTTTTNYRSFELGVNKFLELPGNSKLLTFLDGDDAFYPGGLKNRVENKNHGVQLSRLDTIQYKYFNSSWSEIGRTRSNYSPTDRLSIFYRNSAFTSGLILTRRFIERVLIKVFSRLSGQTWDLLHEDWLTWALAMILELDSFNPSITGVYRSFGFVRKEKYPEDAEVREGLCRLMTSKAIKTALVELGKEDLVKQVHTATVDISYSSFKINF
jgi:hypothetical protein